MLGIDASADGMRQASRRAARSPSRGGQPNARFLVAALEQLPRDFDGLADLVTVHFPWGSLRSAAAGHEPELTERLVHLVRPGGRLELLLADAERDGAAPIAPGPLVAVFERLGLRAVEIRPAMLTDAIEVHSAWGKRLLRHRAEGRMAWRIRLERHPADMDAHG